MSSFIKICPIGAEKGDASLERQYIYVPWFSWSFDTIHWTELPTHLPNFIKIRPIEDKIKHTRLPAGIDIVQFSIFFFKHRQTHIGRGKFWRTIHFRRWRNHNPVLCVLFSSLSIGAHFFYLIVFLVSTCQGNFLVHMHQ